MIEDRLDNWGRYYRTRMKIEVCGSVEKMYRAPWRQWVSINDINHPIPIDWQDAELVEQAWRGMLGTPKLILKYIYMHNFKPAIVCRKCRVKIWHLDKEIRRAMNVMQAALDRLDKESTIAGNSKPPPGEDNHRLDGGLSCSKEPEPA